jgi:hypothetical protein
MESIGHAREVGSRQGRFARACTGAKWGRCQARASRPFPPRFRRLSGDSKIGIVVKSGPSTQSFAFGISCRIRYIIPINRYQIKAEITSRSLVEPSRNLWATKYLSNSDPAALPVVPTHHGADWTRQL